jgi:hypothetical protein
MEDKLEIIASPLLNALRTMLVENGSAVPIGINALLVLLLDTGGARLRPVLAASFDQNMSLTSQHQSREKMRYEGRSNLQCILAGKTFIAMRTWKRLHRQMYALMSFQVVIPVEALRALITLERPVVGRPRLVDRVRRVPAVHLLHAGHVATVETGEDAWLHATEQRHLAVWTVYVRHHRPVHRRQRVRRPRLA